MSCLSKVFSGIDLGVRFTQQVLGAGGAFLGSCGYLGFGGSASAGTAKTGARVAASFALVKFVHANSNKDGLKSKAISTITQSECFGKMKPGLMQVMLFVNLLINLHTEVLGAGGALWGTSEYLGVRDESNNTEWQVRSTALTSAALVRFIALSMLSSKNKLIVDAREKIQSKVDLITENSQSMANLVYLVLFMVQFIDLLIQFDLEGPGAGGAIWGTAEYLNLRDSSDDPIWQGLAILGMVAGSVRFIYNKSCPAKEALEEDASGKIEIVVEGDEIVSADFETSQDLPSSTKTANSSPSSTSDSQSDDSIIQGDAETDASDSGVGIGDPSL